MLENMKDSMTFDKWLFKYSKNSEYNIELWNILFQISVGCYAMSLCELVHNDLHSSNIFIKDLGVVTSFIYDINDIKIVIKTKFQPLIYDFDRGYTSKLGENLLLNDICEKSSQCNSFVENKDIIKILCYVYKYINEITIRNKIIEIISKYDDNEKVKSIYNYKTCYLQYINAVEEVEAIPIDKYSLYFNDTFGILFRIFNRVLPKYDYSEEKIEPDNSFT